VVTETVQQISYVCQRFAVGTGVSGIRAIFRLWVADIRDRNHMNKSLEMRICQKLNSKMLRDSGFVSGVLASLSTETVLCCDSSFEVTTL